MTVPLSSSSTTVPAWRREPYRALFPLGILLAWAGVLHWLLLATGVIQEYRSIFHAFAQIEGFMTCFAVGFLFTLIPRRTSTAPPAAWQMAIAVVAPVVITILLLAALALRALVNVDQTHVYRWLGSASAASLVATIVWALFLIRSLRRAPR